MRCGAVRCGEKDRAPFAPVRVNPRWCELTWLRTQESFLTLARRGPLLTRAAHRQKRFLSESEFDRTRHRDLNTNLNPRC